MKSISNIASVGGGGGGAGIFEDYTLLSSGWVLNATTGYYEYSLESDYPSSSYNVIVGTIDDMNAVVYNQAHAACMVGDDSANKLICLGTKPTANIPVLLYILET